MPVLTRRPRFRIRLQRNQSNFLDLSFDGCLILRCSWFCYRGHLRRIDCVTGRMSFHI
jgi:hypothetical protein